MLCTGVAVLVLQRPSPIFKARRTVHEQSVSDYIRRHSIRPVTINRGICVLASSSAPLDRDAGVGPEDFIQELRQNELGQGAARTVRLVYKLARDDDAAERLCEELVRIAAIHDAHSMRLQVTALQKEIELNAKATQLQLAVADKNLEYEIMQAKAYKHAAMYLRVRGLFSMRGLQERFEEFLRESLAELLTKKPYTRYQLFVTYLSQDEAARVQGFAARLATIYPMGGKSEATKIDKWARKMVTMCAVLSARIHGGKLPGAAGDDDDVLTITEDVLSRDQMQVLKVMGDILGVETKLMYQEGNIDLRPEDAGQEPRKETSEVVRIAPAADAPAAAGADADVPDGSV
eukprot:jgi/Chlat1/4498/Chrsp29S08891